MHFDQFGNPAPPGVTPLTIEEFRHSFVEKDEKICRGALFANFSSYNQAFASVTGCSNWRQWIGGGYTTNKKNPLDIDVVNLVDEDVTKAICASPAPLRTRGISEPGLCSKQTFKVDGYIVPILQESDHRYQAITQKLIAYWTKWLGRDRQGNARAIIERVAP